MTKDDKLEWLDEIDLSNPGYDLTPPGHRVEYIVYPVNKYYRITSEGCVMTKIEEVTGVEYRVKSQGGIQ